MWIKEKGASADPADMTIVCGLPTILASACVGQYSTRHHGQADCVVEFAIGEQPSIGGHHGTAKLEHQAAVKIEPNSIRFRFTEYAVRIRRRCRALKMTTSRRSVPISRSAYGFCHGDRGDVGRSRIPYGQNIGPRSNSLFWRLNSLFFEKISLLD